MAVTLEEVITELVVNGGNAKSRAIEAIEAARKGDFELADEKIREADDYVTAAHEFQTGIIQKEASGEEAMEVSLIMVHGQDHLMNAMTTRDLAVQIVDLCKIIYRDKQD
ncbi:PTS lactose/cellobiose transporter subunit IIA [Lachnospiraceae bacterium 54-53]